MSLFVEVMEGLLIEFRSNNNLLPSFQYLRRFLALAHFEAQNLEKQKRCRKIPGPLLIRSNCFSIFIPFSAFYTSEV
ncbi:serine/threonine-protein kinase ATM [Dorcoceras hygrometricum]|uniref:Serine/threonine-protein kinase ATM n=1 Tax=Dorcoceras hygrometricum TaxID=472368 RepID=A0A2Z7AGF0_9LAMI|nr:serine/threonine-protein kinase ATM [Dorcoceras hygrometricum]